MLFGISWTFAILVVFSVDANPESKIVDLIGKGTAPNFYSDFYNTTVTETVTLTVYCSPTGDLPMTFVWYNEQGERFPLTSLPRIYVTVSSNRSSLTFKPVKISDSGVYTCSANNSYGSASYLVQLKVIPISEDPCFNEPCQHGYCKIQNGAAECICSGRYTGRYCEKDPCLMFPCLNGGSCEVANGTASCVCRSGYEGRLCGRGPCTRYPCLNGGTCDMRSGVARCYCRDGYTGRLCGRVTRGKK